jgi:hypothetical protein
MSRKHFSWLLFTTFVVAAAVLLMPGKTGRESALEATRILPDLESRVNEVDWLRVTGAGDRTIATLKREQGAWVVEEAAGYRADWLKLKTLLTDLAQAEVVEAKTANPEYYDRLGVEDVATPGAGGVMIEFSADSGIPSVIVGKTPQGRSGQYLRLADSTASALVDRSLDLPAERRGWLDRAIIDIGDDEVVEVSVIHPDGEEVRISKGSAGEENFDLQDIPEGREIRSEWTVNAPANALAGLALEDVAADGEIDWSEAVRYSLMTADRLLIDAELVTVDPAGDDESGQAEYWLRISAGVYTTALEPGADPAGSAEATVARAEALNRSMNGWAYRIPKYKYDAMVKRLEDLLQPLETATGSGG